MEKTIPNKPTKEMTIASPHTNLIGDVESSGVLSVPVMAEFLGKLEQLMGSYLIEKLDIGWSRFSNSDKSNVN